VLVHGLDIAEYCTDMNARIAIALTFGVSMAVLGAVTPAGAATIDFTNAAAWSAANGTSIYTSPTLFDGVTVTVTSQGPSGLLTFNSGADINPTCAALTGLSCGGDGLGVSDDEVTVGSGLTSPSLERIFVYFKHAGDRERHQLPGSLWQ
jgi:hypothetical protein